MRASTLHFVGLATTLAVALTLGVGVPGIVHAQSDLKAKIPFEFYAGNQKFAPGDYTVRDFGTYIQLSDRKGHSTFVMTTAVTKSNWRDIQNGLLVFSNYGEYRFLSQVWTEGYSFGKELLKVPLEVEIAQKELSNQKIALRAGR